ncbi:TetR/AcrR family transcriptional regulator, partial [Acinetobacter baumannii]|nr:TetR/AcrR family transcriptional regulator [Acinetobacter baumannii]
MQKIQQPKKQPEIIRKNIIEQAIILASEKGTSGVSIQNVANGAGITKGGVFHHFANKQILVEAMISEIISHLD